MARLYLIEDDEGVRQQLALLLQGAGHEVLVPDGFEALGAKVAAADPDLVVLDLGLPGTDGQYVAREIRQVSDVPIMVLTSRSSELDELMSLTVGADDFVAKSTNPQLILAHVDALLRRSSRGTTDHVVRWDGVELDLVRSRASSEGGAVELTKNELRILELLMRREGGIVSRDELMEALWATDSFVDDNTLTVNMNRLRQTLAKIGQRDLVVT
ncbi:MAG: response regulator transcription factor, partial [Atopobiaceae bacterium]